MRILHLVHQYPPEHVGGVELYTQSTADGLSRRGHAVGVFYRRDFPGRGWEEQPQGSVHLFPAWDEVRSPAQRFAATFGARHLAASADAVLDHFQPDLVHIQHLMGLPLALLESLERRKLPFVITLHDYWYVCVNANLRTNYNQTNCAGPQGHLNCTRCVLARSGTLAAWPLAPVVWAGLRWRAGQLRRWLEQARLVLAPSTYVRSWYLEHGLQARRFEVLGLGVTAPAAVEAAALPVTPLVTPPETPPVSFLYLGSIDPIKGVHILLEAFRAVTGRAELWVAGDLTHDTAYTARLQGLANGAVRFLGRLERAEVWRTLAACDVVLAPSLVPETFCMVSHEAFAAGKPVIASRIGALAESVGDGQNGCLLEPGDVAQWRSALQRVVDDPTCCARWRAQIQPPMTVDAHVDQLLAYYTQALE